MAQKHILCSWLGAPTSGSFQGPKALGLMPMKLCPQTQSRSRGRPYPGLDLGRVVFPGPSAPSPEVSADSLRGPFEQTSMAAMKTGTQSLLGTATGA